MKRMKRITAGLFAVLLAAQCASAAAAAEPQEESERWYTIVSDERDDEGNLMNEYIMDEEGNRFPLEDTAVYAASEDEFPASYDARDLGLVTPVKNQSDSGCCWTFAAIAAAESNYIKQGYGSASDTDFSESHAAWFSQRSRSNDPSDSLYGDGVFYEKPYNEGGNWTTVTASFMRGSGLLFEENAPWTADKSLLDNYKKMNLPESERYACDVRVTGVNCMRKASVSAIKHAILEYGAVSINYYNNQQKYNRATGGYFQNEVTDRTGHEACIVGWDDHYPVKNFLNPKPQRDGAWLVKNSWGAIFCKSGYFWMSYEEPSVVNSVTFETAPKNIFDNVYQYDGSRPDRFLKFSGNNDTIKIANVFTAEKTELLTHAAYYLTSASTEPVSVQVYMGEPKSTATSDPFQWLRPASDPILSEDTVRGYHTVELPSPVKLDPGQTFAIVVTLGRSDDGYVYVPTESSSVPASKSGTEFLNGRSNFSLPMESFIYRNNKWRACFRDMSEDAEHIENRSYNVPVKAMTRDLDETENEPLLQIETLPEKTDYSVGDKIDLDGLTLIFTDAKGESTQIDAAKSNAFTISDQYVQRNGSNQIILSYKGVRTGFEVNGKDGTELHIRRPVFRTKWFGEKIRLYADLNAAPDGASVKWEIQDENNETIESIITAKDTPFTFDVRGNGKYRRTFVATLLDADGQRILNCFGQPLTDSVEIIMDCSSYVKLFFPIIWLLSQLGWLK